LKESDYIAKIASLEAENAALRVKVSGMALLESDNLMLQQRVSELAQTVADLIKKMEQSSVRKNSQNSSIPPSSDLSRKNKSLRKKSGRKPGGQRGHSGTTLKMTDTPDHIERLVPVICEACCATLDATLARVVERRQVVDIPPIQAEVTEFQACGIMCGCGKHQIAAFPQGVDNHVQYGPNIAALTVYHSVYQYIPYKRLQHFFAHVCHLPISIGTLENIVTRMADKARPIWQDLRSKVETAPSVGSDETGVKVNGGKQWVWVWQTAMITFLAVSAKRGSQIIEQLFPQGFQAATLCSDRWRAQIKTTAQNHQLCLAHLLRELIYLIACEKTAWASAFKELLQDAIQLKKNQEAYPKDDPVAIQIEERLDELLQQNLEDGYIDKTIAFKKSMNKYRNYLLPFLYNPLVTFDNNASERGIRNLKVKLKVSGQFKTGHEDYCILRSIIDTTIKQGNSILDAIAAIARLPTPPKAAV
jgi:transposase